jgi:ABC-type Fe3+ transport system permease subunit
MQQLHIPGISEYQGAGCQLHSKSSILSMASVLEVSAKGSLAFYSELENANRIAMVTCVICIILLCNDYRYSGYKEEVTKRRNHGMEPWKRAVYFVENMN